MTHHEMKKEEKKTSTSGNMPEYESEMKKRGEEIQEGRIKEKEAGAQMKQTGMGRPEAEERPEKMGAGMPEYESEMKKRGQEIQEGRIREKEESEQMKKTKR